MIPLTHSSLLIFGDIISYPREPQPIPRDPRCYPQETDILLFSQLLVRLPLEILRTYPQGTDILLFSQLLVRLPLEILRTYPQGTDIQASPREEIPRAHLCTRVYTVVYTCVYSCVHTCILIPPR